MWMIGWTGFFAIAAALIWVGLAVYNRFIREPTSWSAYKGAWAIVTGASDGIGAAYATALAKRGLNVVVMARTKEKLDKLAKSITDQYSGVRVRVVPFDFSQEQAAYESMAKELSDIKVSVLVGAVLLLCRARAANLKGLCLQINNVGGSGLAPEYHTVESLKFFVDRKISDAEQTVLLNTRPLMTMTRIFAERMREAKIAGRIINVSSVGGLVALPLSSPYSGTKAFTDAFTRSLIPELQQVSARMLSYHTKRGVCDLVRWFEC